MQAQQTATTSKMLPAAALLRSLTVAAGTSQDQRIHIGIHIDALSKHARLLLLLEKLSVTGHPLHTAGTGSYITTPVPASCPAALLPCCCRLPATAPQQLWHRPENCHCLIAKTTAYALFFSLLKAVRTSLLRLHLATMAL
jgi:hypothetical protein